MIHDLLIGLQTHSWHSNHAQLDKLHHLQTDLIFDVVRHKVQEHTRTHEFQVSGNDCVLDAVVLEQSLVVETSPDAKEPACILDNPFDMLTHPQKRVVAENNALETKALEKKISQLVEYQRRIQSEEQVQSDSFVRTLDVVESIKGEASNTQ